MKIFPQKLKAGNEIRIIAPSRSMGILSEDIKEIASDRLNKMGFKVTFGSHVSEMDDFKSSSVVSRISDLHNAFSDQNVKGILTVIGGFNSNQLLNSIDWDLIENNPKVLCGYSDITILNNAIYSKTGLVNYSGLHYSSFGEKLHFDYSLEYFKKCCMNDDSFEIKPSTDWNDDSWYKDQDNRKLINNDGYLVVNEGQAEGTILGANLCTFNLLQGTEYMPDLSDSVLFLEDDAYTDGVDVVEFDRNLQSLIQQPSFEKVKGLVLGRFQIASKMTNELLAKIIESKKQLDSIPIIANVDFGHTNPKATFPIGGDVSISAKSGQARIEITRH